MILTKTTKKPSKKAISKELTMKKLLASGLEVFSKYGFDGATTKMVAEHSGVNEALINRYFNGKVGLMDAIFLEYFQTTDMKVRKYALGDTLEEDIENFITCLVNDFCKNTKLLKMLSAKMIIDTNLQKKIRSNLQIPNDRLWNQLIFFQKKKVIHSSHDLLETCDVIAYFVSGIINNKASLKFSLTKKEGVIKNFARMLARDLGQPK